MSRTTSGLFRGQIEWIALAALVALVEVAAWSVAAPQAPQRVTGSEARADSAPSAPSAQANDDVRLALSVRAALLSDPLIHSERLAVFSDEGQVRLSGTMGSESERAHATALTAALAGVHRVDNRVTLTASASPRPAERETLLAQSLQSNTTRGK
jgi:osmotically-inducible protein OsmY